jgi:hypothetical protein
VSEEPAVEMVSKQSATEILARLLASVDRPVPVDVVAEWSTAEREAAESWAYAARARAEIDPLVVDDHCSECGEFESECECAPEPEHVRWWTPAAAKKVRARRCRELRGELTCALMELLSDGEPHSTKEIRKYLYGPNDRKSSKKARSMLQHLKHLGRARCVERGKWQRTGQAVAEGGTRNAA